MIAALLRLLTITTEASDPAPQHWAVIAEQADLLVAAAQREVAEPADLAVVHDARNVLDRALRHGRPNTHRGSTRDETVIACRSKKDCSRGHAVPDGARHIRSAYAVGVPPSPSSPSRSAVLRRAHRPDR